MDTKLFVCLTFILFLIGCGVTNIHSKVDSNPLKHIAQKASDKYSIKWIDDNTMTVSDWWPTHSCLSLGYTAFHAEMKYSDGLLEGDYYVQSNQVFTLFFPTRVDVGPAFWGGALKPYIKSQINEILGYAGSSMESSSVQHGVSKSVVK